MAQAQSFDAGNSSDLQNNKPVTAKRMKRMGDQRPSQRGIGQECSLNGLSQLLEIESFKEHCSMYAYFTTMGLYSLTQAHVVAC